MADTGAAVVVVGAAVVVVGGAVVVVGATVVGAAAVSPESESVEPPQAATAREITVIMATILCTEVSWVIERRIVLATVIDSQSVRPS
jgi:hypothetical protein